MYYNIIYYSNTLCNSNKNLKIVAHTLQIYCTYIIVSMRDVRKQRKSKKSMSTLSTEVVSPGLALETAASIGLDEST